MTEFIMLAMLCVLSGAIVGLLPGMTPLMGLMLVLPVIQGYSAEVIIIFWACYLSVTQYYGSVGALLFKVPGETSSLPVLNASRDFRSVRNVVRAYRNTALGSLMASLLAAALLAVTFIWLRDSWHVLFGTRFTVSFLIVLFVILVMLNGRYALNLAMIGLGLTLSNLPEIHSITSLCSSSSWLCFTLKPTDFMLAILCLYAVPYLFVRRDNFDGRDMGKVSDLSWRSAAKFWPISVRHGLLGFIVGFVPGMGVTLSSNTSAALEHSRNPRRRMRIMVAAESANNASIVSCMIPFLVMGIPITSTELLLDQWIAVNKAVNINAEFLYNTVFFAGYELSMASALIMALTATCVVCFFLTSRFIWLYNSLYRVPPELLGGMIKALIVLFLVMTVMQAELAVSSTIFTLILFSAIGIWAVNKKRDVIALPISLMIGHFAVAKFITAYQLWS